MKKVISILIIECFFVTCIMGPNPVNAQEFRLPAPGVMVHLSPEFNPPILKGIKVHPDNPFHFDFILDQGDSFPKRMSSPNVEDPVKGGGLIGDPQQEQLKQQATRLIKYFLASLTIPEKDLWVNLSPYEKNRIVPESFGQTEMGRDLLAEDYMLKQITASLIYPEDEIGKKFWKRIYEEAQKRFGTTNIPVNTFNKVWIVPEKAVVYENAKVGTAYVVESSLKVMLEQDYLSLEKHTSKNTVILSEAKDLNKINLLRDSSALPQNDLSLLGSQIIRDIVIPELTKEVNEGKNFSQLRQVYNSLILATWYKKKIKDSILEQVYADKNKTAGVQYTSTVIPAKAGPQTGHSQELGIQNRINSDMDPRFVGNDNKKDDIELIYQRYLQAFKKGAFNYIKEEIISDSGMPSKEQGIFPRKYFSGGVGFDGAQLVRTEIFIHDSAILSKNTLTDFAVISANIKDLPVVRMAEASVNPSIVEIPKNGFNNAIRLASQWPRKQINWNKVILDPLKSRAFVARQNGETIGLMVIREGTLMSNLPQIIIEGLEVREDYLHKGIIGRSLVTEAARVSLDKKHMYTTQGRVSLEVATKEDEGFYDHLHFDSRDIFRGSRGVDSGDISYFMSLTPFNARQLVKEAILKGLISNDQAMKTDINVEVEFAFMLTKVIQEGQLANAFNWETIKPLAEILNRKWLDKPGIVNMGLYKRTLRLLKETHLIGSALVGGKVSNDLWAIHQELFDLKDDNELISRIQESWQQFLSDGKEQMKGEVSNTVRKAMERIIASRMEKTGLRVGDGFWNEEHAREAVWWALDRIKGFREARQHGEIKEMARLYREEMSKFPGQQINYFVESGLSGLMGNSYPFLDKLDSAAALLRFALPGLVDEEAEGAIRPWEIEDVGASARVRKKAILQALYTIEGFKEANIKDQVRLYRQRVIGYPGGQLMFFYNKGLKGMIQNYCSGSPVVVLKFAMPELADQNNPGRLLIKELRHGLPGQVEAEKEAIDTAKHDLAMKAQSGDQPQFDLVLLDKNSKRELIESALKNFRGDWIKREKYRPVAEAIQKKISLIEGRSLLWIDFSNIPGITEAQLRMVFVLNAKDLVKTGQMGRRKFVGITIGAVAALAAIAIVVEKMGLPAEGPVHFEFVFNSHRGKLAADLVVKALEKTTTKHKIILFMEDFKQLKDLYHIIDHIKKDVIELQLTGSQLKDNRRLLSINRSIGLNTDESTDAKEAQRLTIADLDKYKELFMRADAQTLLKDPNIKLHAEIYAGYLSQERQELPSSLLNFGGIYGETLDKGVQDKKLQIVYEGISVDAMLMEEANQRFHDEAIRAMLEDKNDPNSKDFAKEYIIKANQFLETEYSSNQLRDRIVADQLSVLAKEHEFEGAKIVVQRGEIHYATLLPDIENFKNKSKYSVNMTFEDNLHKNPQKLTITQLTIASRVKDGVYHPEIPVDNDQNDQLKRIFLEQILSSPINSQTGESIVLLKSKSEKLRTILMRLSGSKLNELIKVIQNNPFGVKVDPIVLTAYALGQLKLKKFAVATDSELQEIFEKVTYTDRTTSVDIHIELSNGKIKDFNYPKDRAMSNSKTGGIDLTPANMNLQTKNAGEEFKFHMDPTMLIQLQNAPGFVPVIINIQPLTDLKSFLDPS